MSDLGEMSDVHKARPPMGASARKMYSASIRKKKRTLPALLADPVTNAVSHTGFKI